MSNTLTLTMHRGILAYVKISLKGHDDASRARADVLSALAEAAAIPLSAIATAEARGKAIMELFEDVVRATETRVIDEFKQRQAEK